MLLFGIVGKGEVVVAEPEGGGHFHQLFPGLYGLIHIPSLEIRIGQIIPGLDDFRI